MKTQNKNALWAIPTHKLHTFDLKNVCNVMPCNEINNLELVVNFVLVLSYTLLAMHTSFE